MSTYTEVLRDLGTDLAKEGWDRRANIVFHAAERMDRMEELIVTLMQNDTAEHNQEETNENVG